MSLSLKTHKIEKWDSVGNNAAQNYLTHTIFRYFGKLPPVLTARILKEFVKVRKNSPPLVLDLMCGSGTTLVESQHMGFESIGVDTNDIALLASRVKTTPVDVKLVEHLLKKFEKEYFEFLDTPTTEPSLADTIWLHWPESKAYLPKFRNIEYWFLPGIQASLALTRQWIDKQKVDSSIHDFFFLCWLAIIRHCSNASVRTGRIFFDKQKNPPSVFKSFHSQVRKVLDIYKNIPEAQFKLRPQLYLNDARQFRIPEDKKADFTFFHPPYFALFKYSSDVLRFELEWSQCDRKRIVKNEIRDGFKTTDPSLMFSYIDDIVLAVQNGFTNTKEGNLVGIVIGNSTLSEKQLPVIETLLERAFEHQIKCERIIERPINHSQATYHKSANPNIRSDADYLIMFSKD